MNLGLNGSEVDLHFRCFLHMQLIVQKFFAHLGLEFDRSHFCGHLHPADIHPLQMILVCLTHMRTNSKQSGLYDHNVDDPMALISNPREAAWKTFAGTIIPFKKG